MSIFIHILIYINCFVAGLLVNNFISGYLRRKGENLATKEDIDTITTKIESIKTANQKSVELLRGDISSKINFTKLRYSKEYDLLSELIVKLTNLRDTALSLRPRSDIVDLNENNEDRKIERLKRYSEVAFDFYKYYETRIPFYPEGIYIILKQFQETTRREALEYKHKSWDPEDRNYDEKYWNNVEKNSEAIILLYDKIIREIRNRITEWESITFNR